MQEIKKNNYTNIYLRLESPYSWWAIKCLSKWWIYWRTRNTVQPPKLPWCWPVEELKYFHLIRRIWCPFIKLNLKWKFIIQVSSTFQPKIVLFKLRSFNQVKQKARKHILAGKCFILELRISRSNISLWFQKP